VSFEEDVGGVGEAIVWRFDVLISLTIFLIVVDVEEGWMAK
jgi:hypothetical protein